MKAQVELSFFFILIRSLNGFHDPVFLASFSDVTSVNEQIIIGTLGEDVILPCSFKSGSEVAIHWKSQDTTYIVHSYFKSSDHLEKQDPRYINRTSLFHSEIHNGNASLSLRRLSLLDEGVYICYVGTATEKIINKVVLNVGAFLMPMMKYEKRNTNSFLICSVLSHPPPIIIWKTDDTPVSKSDMEDSESWGLFYTNNTLDVTGSNSSYECIIENPLLNQTWMGRWTREDGFHKMQSEHVSLSCQLVHHFFPPSQDFNVTWSRVESGNSSVLASYPSSSQNAVIRELRFSWNREPVQQSDFSMTLTDLSPSDSGEYLCNVSSRKYTLLTIHTLYVEQSQAVWKIVVPILSVVVIALILITLCLQGKSRNFGNSNTDHLPDPTNEKASRTGNVDENMPLTNTGQGGK